MSKPLSDVVRTTFQAYVLGDKDVLLNARHYTSPPTDDDLSTILTRFNYPRRPEMHASAVIVTQTTVTVSRRFSVNSDGENGVIDVPTSASLAPEGVEIQQ